MSKKGDGGVSWKIAASAGIVGGIVGGLVVYALARLKEDRQDGRINNLDARMNRVEPQLSGLEIGVNEFEDAYNMNQVELQASHDTLKNDLLQLRNIVQTIPQMEERTDQLNSRLVGSGVVKGTEKDSSP